MERDIVDVYTSLDQGWRACILAAVILLGALVVAAV